MTDPKPICLGLQGGGAHGAFTWGVLDRLLESGKLKIVALSGTSAGAMNTVAFAEGFARNGADGARECLERFWRCIAEAGQASPIRRSPIDMLMGNWSLDTSPSYVFFDLLSRLASPYELNPMNINPVRDLVEEIIDFDRVQACSDIGLYVSATNVETGRARVFRREELTADVVMASACLPLLFQAVEINGVPYWDGGYMGNPALYPMFENGQTRDILIVQINPILRAGTPKTAREILNRLNEITFNSSLQRELRAINFVSRLIESGKLASNDYKQLLIHRINADETLKSMGASSKLNAEWTFLTHLKELGRKAADHWLDHCFDHVGHRSTVDVRSLFQGHRDTTPDNEAQTPPDELDVH